MSHACWYIPIGSHGLHELPLTLACEDPPRAALFDVPVNVQQQLAFSSSHSHLRIVSQRMWPEKIWRFSVAMAAAATRVIQLYGIETHPNEDGERCVQQCTIANFVPK